MTVSSGLRPEINRALSGHRSSGRIHASVRIFHCRGLGEAERPQGMERQVGFHWSI